MRRPFGGKTLHLSNASCFYTTEVRSNQTLRMTYVIVLVLTYIRVDILYGHILDYGRVCVLIVEKKSRSNLHMVYHVDSVPLPTRNYPRDP